jgi:hypothetical protein
MEANYVHKDSTTLVQDELVKNELNQIELQYNALKQQKFNELLKENQELKLELSGYRQAILNNKEMLGLKEQNEELKKQLEEYIKQNMKLKDELFDKRKEYQDTYKDVRIEIKEYKTQQKEFIKYLEDMLDDENDIFSVVRVKDVLQKYKEIIGDINDKK